MGFSIARYNVHIFLIFVTALLLVEEEHVHLQAVN